MTIPTFDTYEQPPVEDSDLYRPIDNIGHVCIVKVREYKPSIITPNSPEGGPGVNVDLVDLDAPGGAQIFRNVLMMTGRIVDGFKAKAGNAMPVVVSWEQLTAKSGRLFAGPVAAAPAQIARATAYYQANGDPFAPTFDTVAADSPPF